MLEEMTLGELFGYVDSLRDFYIDQGEIENFLEARREALLSMQELVKESMRQNGMGERLIEGFCLVDKREVKLN